jgi:hypothetical protein
MITGMSITILSRLGILICGISGVMPTLGILTSGISGAVTVGISKFGITGRLTAVVPAGAGAGASASSSSSLSLAASPDPYGAILNIPSVL